MTKATGGGAHKFADLFKERLGLILDKEDEMSCLVSGANFLLKVDPTLGIICFSCICLRMILIVTRTSCELKCICKSSLLYT